MRFTGELKRDEDINYMGEFERAFALSNKHSSPSPFKQGKKEKLERGLRPLSIIIFPPSPY